MPASRRMRYPGTWAALLAVSFLAGCSSDDSAGIAAPTTGSTSPVAMDPLPFEELPPPVYRGGDVLLSLSGFEPDAAGEVHPIAYLAPADGSAEATPVDLSEVGPRFAVQVGWSGEEFLLAGLRCPDRWDPDEHPADSESPDTNTGNCGSTFSDVFALEPEDASLRPLATEIDGGEDFSLVFEAATLEQAVFSGGGPDGEWLLIAAEGTVESIDRLHRGNTDQGARVCPVDGSLYGVTTRPIEGGQADPPLDLAEHVQVSELVDGSWEPRSRPVAGVVTPYAWIAACTARGPLVTGTYDATGAPLGFASLELVDSEWSWRRLEPDGIGAGDGQTLAPGAIGGAPVMSLTWLAGQAPEAADYAAPQPFWVWDGSMWQFYEPTSAFPAVVFGDHEGLLAFTEAGELVVLRPSLPGGEGI